MSESVTNLFNLPKEMIIKILVHSGIKSIDLTPLENIEKSDNSFKNRQDCQDCQYIYEKGIRKGIKCNLWDCQFHKIEPVNITKVKETLEKDPYLLLNILNFVSFISKFHEVEKCPNTTKCENCIDDYIYFERLLSFIEEIKKTGPSFI